jgi:hypothetical protein
MLNNKLFSENIFKFKRILWMPFDVINNRTKQHNVKECCFQKKDTRNISFMAFEFLVYKSLLFFVPSFCLLLTQEVGMREPLDLIISCCCVTTPSCPLPPPLSPSHFHGDICLVIPGKNFPTAYEVCEPNELIQKLCIFIPEVIDFFTF